MFYLSKKHNAQKSLRSNVRCQMSDVSRGFIFLEILIAVALVSLVFITLMSVAALSVNLSYTIQRTTQIQSLLKEEMEMTRSFRDGTTWGTDGLGTIATGSANPKYFALDNSVNPPKWAVQTGSETIGDFSRSIVFDKVSRDPTTSNIETTYNALHDDANTRKATVTVTWSGKTYQVVSYFTNWH